MRNFLSRQENLSSHPSICMLLKKKIWTDSKTYIQVIIYRLIRLYLYILEYIIYIYIWNIYQQLIKIGYEFERVQGGVNGRVGERKRKGLMM